MGGGGALGAVARGQCDRAAGGGAGGGGRVCDRAERASVVGPGARGESGRETGEQATVPGEPILSTL